MRHTRRPLHSRRPSRRARFACAALFLLANFPASAHAAEAVATLPSMPYRPFIDPLDLHRLLGPARILDDAWLVLLIPMALGISIAYKAARVKTMDRYWSQVALLTTQIVLGMTALAVTSYLLVLIYAKFIAERFV